MTISAENAITLRPAHMDDAPVIAEIHVRAWQERYRGMMPDAFLDALAPEQRHARWEAFIDAPDAEMTVIVAVEREDGRIVGFCSVCPQQHLEPGDADTAGELYTMYVDGRAQGGGIGRLLIAAAETRMRAMGCRRGVLWMVAANQAARGFYEHLGWQADGVTRTMTYGDRVVPEIRLTRALHSAEDGS